MKGEHKWVCPVWNPSLRPRCGVVLLGELPLGRTVCGGDHGDRRNRQWSQPKGVDPWCIGSVELGG